MRVKRMALAAAVGAFFASGPAFGWGSEGHQIVAHLAAHSLSPKAQFGVAVLLGGDAEAAMVQVSTWADEIRRSRPETAPWHYVDIPIGSSGYDAAHDCANDDCVVAQIARDATIVGDTSLAQPVRAEALRFLIHFVADVHQPLHASNNNDRGGNEVRVLIGDERTNLHAVWDRDVIATLGSDPVAVAQQLEAQITPAERQSWTQGSPVDWANESFGVATHAIYAKLNGQGGTDAPLVLPPSYPESERAVVSLQLERAGVRLATLLNRAFP